MLCFVRLVLGSLLVRLDRLVSAFVRYYSMNGANERNTRVVRNKTIEVMRSMKDKKHNDQNAHLDKFRHFVLSGFGLENPALDVPIFQPTRCEYKQSSMGDMHAPRAVGN